MRKFESELCLNRLDVYYSNDSLTTHGPSALEMRVGQFEKETNPSRFEDLKVCSDALAHVRQVRACLKYLMTHPMPVASVDAEMENWVQAIQAELNVSRLQLRDALLLAKNAEEVDWSRMDLEV